MLLLSFSLLSGKKGAAMNLPSLLSYYEHSANTTELLYVPGCCLGDKNIAFKTWPLRN